MNHGLWGTAFLLHAALRLRVAVYTTRLIGELALAAGHIAHGVHSTVRLSNGAVAWTVGQEGIAWFVLSLALLGVALVEIAWLAWKLGRQVRSRWPAISAKLARLLDWSS